MRFLFSLLIVLLAAGVAWAGSLDILADENPPFSLDQNGTASGFCGELVRELATRTGDEMEIEFVSKKEALDQVRGGGSRAAYPVARTGANQAEFSWVGPLVEYDVALYALKDRAIAVDSVADAARYKIASTWATADREFVHAVNATQISFVAREHYNATKLFGGLADLWLAGELAARQTAREHGYDFNKLEAVFVEREEGLFLAFPLDADPAVVSAWQGALDAMKADGSYQALYDGYFGE